MEVKEQELENVQIGGCMAGFFNIFDRPHHLLSPKRLALPKRISSSSSSSSTQSAPASPSKQEIMTLPVVMETKQGGVCIHNNNNNKSPPLWRFSKEAPRLSLDSRAVVDAKGSLKPRPEESQRGSPSVIARLMGLEEPLPTLQRSASESRVRRFVDTFSFQNPLSDEKQSPAQDPAVRSARAPAPARKSFFDSADYFPEPRQMNDLETLKQLLEALRLKGLLHSSNKQKSRNVVFDYHHQSPPITSIRSRSPPTSPKGSDRRRSPIRQPEQHRRVSPLPWPRPEPLHTRASQEIWNVDECSRQGKTLLERCDKLLHSIAEMAASEAGDSQPSPVSVLDASLYHEDSSPSPVMKRTLHFQQDESWGASSIVSPEYVYISDILRASDCLPQDSDIFSFLEKHQCLNKGKQTIIPQERHLIFDAVQEILGRRRRLPPWRRVWEDDDEIQVIWSEFQKMQKTREESSEDDLVGYVYRVLETDLSEDRWRDCEVEMSEAVLDIERLIFKDLIGDTIRDLTALNRSHSLLRRRLVFF